MIYYGQFFETKFKPLDQVLFENYLKGIQDGFYIEAGAYDGITLSTCKAMEDAGWSGINVEPCPGIFDQLKKNRPDSININAALSDTRGVVPFQRFKDDIGYMNHIVTDSWGVMNSDVLEEIIMPRPEQIMRLEEFRANPTNAVVIEVPTITYCDLLSENNITRPVDLFVLDVEAYEIPVLTNMLLSQNLPKILCVEHKSTGIERIKAVLNDTYILLDIDSLNAIFMKA